MVTVGHLIVLPPYLPPQSAGVTPDSWILPEFLYANTSRHDVSLSFSFATNAW